MKYILLAHDKQNFVSHDGVEKELKFNPKDGYSYFYCREKNIVISLKTNWVDSKEEIGELLNEIGEQKSTLPPIGVLSGRFSVGPIIDGDAFGIEFIVDPYGTESQFSMKYSFTDKSYLFSSDHVR